MNQSRHTFFLNHLKFLVFLLTISPICNLPLAAQTDEYTLKAAFLERFTRFIEWPGSSSVADPEKPFTITVIGQNPFNTLLGDIYDNHRVKNKYVRIRYINKINDIQDTDLLFISRSKKRSLAKIITRIADKPILTVGDSEDYAAQGVHINFYFSGTSIQFEINPEAMRGSQLQASFQLLKLARIVGTEGGIP
ncbi:MAG: YfiR family protein [Calditrichaeota bacterium]|nr:MAG: YfiR family protein [Calditrichota bacterium]